MGPGLTNWSGAKLAARGVADGLTALACVGGVPFSRATAPQAARVRIASADGSRPCRMTSPMQRLTVGDCYACGGVEGVLQSRRACFGREPAVTPQHLPTLHGSNDPDETAVGRPGRRGVCATAAGWLLRQRESNCPRADPEADR